MSQGIRVRIYCDSRDHWGSKPLVHAVIESLWQEHASGVTVIHAAEGFGASRRMHTTRFEVLSANLPVIIEWIDSPERHAEIWPKIQPVVQGVLVTREEVELISVPTHDQ